MSEPIDDESHRSEVIQIWIKIVQTQEHFNEIEMKIRTIYFTVLAAITSAYGIFVKESKDIDISIVDLKLDPVIPICLAVSLSSALFYFVDRYWYHRLLMGAVRQGAEIEARWGKILPEIAMGAKISKESPIDLSDKTVLRTIAKIFANDKNIRDKNELHSDGKIELFYKPVGWMALVLALCVSFVGGIRYEGRSIAEFFVSLANLVLA